MKMNKTIDNVMHKVIKVIVYLRVSSGRQAEFGNSINGQRIYIQRWAEQHRFHIEKITFYNDVAVITGSKPNLAILASKSKTGISDEVHPFVSIWRGNRDINLWVK